ncbi:MAG TPA: hypothetical protein PJ982_04510, partial [Lacipirellulaceae bacterium]|nr:hypothetical protein [Lacipirellulaceae bacterium]
MADALSPAADPASEAGAELGPPATDRRRQETESRVAEISSLLAALEEAAVEGRPAAGLSGPRSPESQPPSTSPDTIRGNDHENRLVQVRLGLASGLFTALRHKHAPTASHTLRLALGRST